MNTNENLLLNVTYTTKPGKRTAFLKALTQLDVVELSISVQSKPARNYPSPGRIASHHHPKQ